MEKEDKTPNEIEEKTPNEIGEEMIEKLGWDLALKNINETIDLKRKGY